MIISCLGIHLNTLKSYQIATPNSTNSNTLCFFSESQAAYLLQYLEIHKHNRHKFHTTTLHRVKLDELKSSDTPLENIIETIDRSLCTRESLKAFNWIKRLTILHPHKRDGGIMNCFSNQDNSLMVHHDAVMQNCLEQLSSL